MPFSATWRQAVPAGTFQRDIQAVGAMCRKLQLDIYAANIGWFTDCCGLIFCCKYHMPTKSTNVYNTTGWYWMKKESINCSKHYCEPWILMVTSILPHIGPMPRRHPFHLWRSCKQLVPCCLGCSNMGHICLWNIYRHVSGSMLHKYNCHNGMYSTIHRYIAIQYSFWFCTYRTCSPIIHIQMYARVLES